jgi:hypothetical protein
MGGFLVSGWGFIIAIYLHQHETRGGIILLADIEPRYTGFLHAVARILKGSRAKRFLAAFLHMNVNMNY